jgi:hypothetical protein
MNPLCPSSYLRDPLKRPKTKIRMTTSWMDYLLCQLSADKRLSILECLAPEILELILEELHVRSVDGLRAFSQVSRTCRALASPYRFKPLHVKVDELVMEICPEYYDPMTVTFCYRDNFKTLKMHGVPRTNLQGSVSIEHLLNAEKSFDCFELLPDDNAVTENICRSSSRLVLEILNRYCPTLSKIVIGLGPFHGYSPGWDREYQESVATRRRLPVKNILLWPFLGQMIIRTLAGFENLSHLTVHFALESDETALMHPNQGQHAVLEMYHMIEKVKKGVRLSQLDVVFSTRSINTILDCSIKHNDDAKAEFAISCRYVEENREGQRHVLTCDGRGYGNIIERRREAVKLYGLRAWHNYLGPCVWEVERPDGRYIRPARMMFDLAIRLALVPSMFKPTDIKKAGRQGFFCA